MLLAKREDRLLVGGVPLHRDLDLAVVGLALEEDGLAVQRVLVLVQVGDEVDDPALVLEGLPGPTPRSSTRLDLQVTGQEGRLAQPLGERLVVEDSTSSKTSPSGRKVIFVPVSLASGPCLRSP